ncbi:MAG: ribosome recycling factor [Amphibacillus sp.]|uniref:Ribosome-recycling factor n=1 Tax=Amphibacillus xylanus (strain ATCC 51415 / DSM 6626 / JCM 7361 / LMG 17667 / NBRC 15112 / Ep01) TaxID=698758 RepID=K0IYK4_AMPXN|nr:ribosome recycling factor [Amphibacillus xylanus]NMA89906.1 ribosome recycling factor [Amphibacillus sp.]BAM47600.1 ribosome-recycling factor [Amphibacillus xylanus NBRC 15112]
MSEAIIKEIQQRMDQAIQSFKRSLATVRAGRANPAILNHVMVDYYGAPTPLNQLATITAPEARLIVVTPFDKSSIGEVEKAIQKADLGLAPSSDGNIVRIVIPALTEERRKELVKVVGKFAEESKVQVRNIRRDANDQLKKNEKDGEITEDELRHYQNEVQAETDKFIKQIDSLVEEKEAEIMEV